MAKNPEYNLMYSLRSSDKSISTISERKFADLDAKIKYHEEKKLQSKQISKVTGGFAAGTGLGGLGVITKAGGYALGAAALMGGISYMANELAEAHQLAIDDLKKQQEVLNKREALERKMSDKIDRDHREFRDKLREGKYRDPDSYPDTGNIA